MSDETQMLRTIDWRSVFPFTQLFRAFRVAIHPAKLVLALLAILLVYTAGRTLDGLWPTGHLAVPGEIDRYEAGGDRATFKADVERARVRLKESRDQLARVVALDTKPADGKATPVADLSDRELGHRIEARRDVEVESANKTYDALATKTPDAKLARDLRVRAAYAAAGETVAGLRASAGRGLCLSFVEYESTQIDAAARGVAGWDWTGERGVLASLSRFVFTGPGWAFAAHPVYFLLFTAIALLVWSVIGGAIARIAAVHVSQDEKISVRQALRFSLNKLMSFFAAPVMPLLLVGIITLLLALVGWLSEVPYLGGLMTILVGALFVVFIGIGVLVACALIGWVCGFGLMYPTIAVEGSDAFDAVSRSFSYVFARPWKIFIYSVLALIYGAVTYLFLRYLIFLTLSVLHGGLTHWTHETAPSGHTSIASAWPGPGDEFHLTTPQHDGSSLTLAEGIGSNLLMFWTNLFVALLGAYLLSYFVSVNTIMYYLLRYDVDATEIDDVYLDPNDDEFEDTMPDPATGTAPTATSPGHTTASSVAPQRVEPSVTLVPAPTPDAPVPDAPVETPPPTMTQPIVDPLATPPTPPPAGS